MKIAIIEQNRDKIEAAFEAANGKARANTLRAYAAYEVAKEAERLLEARGIPKSHRKGAEAFYTPCGPAKAYRYSMTTTSIRMERGAAGWHLVDVNRVGIWAGHSGGTQLIVTEKQAEIITKAALSGLHVKKAA
ncbi:hypothetical protein CN198_14370 [Sinorhizobium meliloti]|uniref:hypothetical protein n=1 Tax=Rhizobium meliloti TaxID=382 RepID=UPI000FD88258|nr:hypothetical protein [Sinorhizobium meliloti]RVH69240.1 hypothetical protein CN198_14370 [Sinorhizobium meliloti]